MTSGPGRGDGDETGDGDDSGNTDGDVGGHFPGDGPDSDVADGTSSMRVSDILDSPESDFKDFDLNHDVEDSGYDPRGRSEARIEAAPLRRDVLQSSRQQNEWAFGVSTGGIAAAGLVTAGGVSAGFGALQSASGKLSVGGGATAIDVGLGFAFGKIGPGLDISYGEAAPRQLSGGCTQQTLFVVPVATLAISAAPDGSFAGATLTLGLSAGVGVFSGTFCGSSIEVFDFASPGSQRGVPDARDLLK